MANENVSDEYTEQGTRSIKEITKQIRGAGSKFQAPEEFPECATLKDKNGNDIKVPEGDVKKDIKKAKMSVNLANRKVADIFLPPNNKSAEAYQIGNRVIINDFDGVASGSGRTLDEAVKDYKKDLVDFNVDEGMPRGEARTWVNRNVRVRKLSRFQSSEESKEQNEPPSPKKKSEGDMNKSPDSYMNSDSEEEEIKKKMNAPKNPEYDEYEMDKYENVQSGTSLQKAKEHIRLRNKK